MYLCGFTLYLAYIGADKLTGLEHQLWPPWRHFTFGHIKIYIMLKVYNVLCGIEAHTIFLKGMSWNVLYECRGGRTRTRAKSLLRNDAENNNIPETRVRSITKDRSLK